MKETLDQLSKLLNTAVGMLGARGGGIYLPNEHKALQLVVKKNRPERFCRPMPEGQGVCGSLLRSPRAYRIVADHGLSPYHYKPFAKDSDFRSVLALKLCLQGMTRGVLFVEDPRTDYFKKEHAEQLEPIASEMSTHLTSIPDLLAAAAMVQINLAEMLVNNAPLGIISAERELITSFNWEASKIFGYAPQEVIDQDLRVLYLNAEVPSSIGKQIRNEGFVERLETTGVSKTGNPIPIRVTVVSLGAHKTVGYIEDLRELNREKELNAILLECTNLLGDAATLRKGLHLLVKHLAKILSVNCCNIYLAKSEHYVLEASSTESNSSEDGRPSEVARQFLDDFLKKGPRPVEKVPELEALQKALHTGSISPTVLAPLRFDEKTIGFLAAGSTPDKDTVEKNLNLFGAIANQVAAFIHERKLFEASEASRKRFQAFQEAGTALISAQAPKAILEKVADQILKGAEAWRVCMLLLSRDGKVSSRTERFLYGLADSVETRPGGLTNWIVKHRKMIVVDDTKYAERSLQHTKCSLNPKILEYGVKAALGLPLHFRDECIGVVWIHYKQARVFSESELQALKIYASQAALALDASRNQWRQQQVLDALQELESATSFDAVQDVLLDKVAKITGFPQIVSRLFDHRKRDFVKGSLKLSTAQQGSPIPFDFDGLEEHMSAGDTNEGYRFIRPDGRTFLCIAISSEISAVILLHMSNEISLDDREQVALKTLAKHAVLAMNRNLTLAHLDHGLALAEVAASAATLDDLRSSLSLFAREIHQRLKCDMAGIVVYDPSRDRIHNPVLAGVMDQFHDDAFLRDKDLVCGLAEGGLWEDFPKPLSGQSLAMLPLRFEGEQLGMLVVSFKEKHYFDDGERQMITMMAKFVSGTVKNALLLEENRGQHRVLEAIQSSGQSTVTSLDLKKSLTLLLRRSNELLGPEPVPHSAVEIWNSKGDALERVAFSGEKGDVVNVTSKKNSPQGMVYVCWKRRSRQLAQNITQNEDYLESRASTCSQLVLPIIAGKEILGVLSVESSKPNVFDDNVIRNFEALVIQASILMQCVRLHDELEQIGGYVGNQTALNWMSMVSATWGHDIKRQVGLARGQLVLLEDEWKGPPSAAAREQMAVLDTSLAHIAEIPMLAPLTQGEQSDVAIFRLIEQYFQSYFSHGQQDPILLKLDLKRPKGMIPQIQASPNWLRRLFEIVAENAVRAMKQVNDLAVKTFEVRAHCEHDQVIIRLRDQGPGVPGSLREVILEKPISRHQGSHGTGIGLVLAQNIAHAYRGHLRLNEDYGGGAEFLLTLPLSKPETVTKEGKHA